MSSPSSPDDADDKERDMAKKMGLCPVKLAFLPRKLLWRGVPDNDRELSNLRKEGAPGAFNIDIHVIIEATMGRGCLKGGRYQYMKLGR